jgi:hypothetical protein
MQLGASDATIVEDLRREARQLIAASRAATDPEEQRYLSEQAFELAQVAEALQRRLADPDLLSGDGDAMKAQAASLAKAKRWRRRAEKFRGIADAMARDSSGRQAYLHLAHSYDTLANQAEARALRRAELKRQSGT